MTDPIPSSILFLFCSAKLLINNTKCIILQFNGYIQSLFLTFTNDYNVFFSKLNLNSRFTRRRVCTNSTNKRNLSAVFFLHFKVLNTPLTSSSTKRALKQYSFYSNLYLYTDNKRQVFVPLNCSLITVMTDTKLLEWVN